jgi:hypothetical protein
MNYTPWDYPLHVDRPMQVSQTVCRNLEYFRSLLSDSVQNPVLQSFGNPK